MENFLSLKLEETLIESLAKINFKTPTPIQAQAIPVALEGKDILGTAQTGTGKTGAFGIPLVNYLLKTKKDTALVITPTRELATQVMQTMNNLVGRGNIRTALLIGGDSMQKQLKQMRRNPRLIVGTPGRINDHLKRQTLKLNNTTFLVLDESDRMLDMGFTPQINQVLETVPKKHQTLLFSATLPGNIIRLAEKYLNQPVRISVGSTSTPIAKIKQEVLRVKDGDKYNQLIKEIYTRQGSILIFVKTRRNAEKMVKRLKYDDHDADAIHGNLRQNKRDRVIKAFRNNHFRILVGTDVASRGLDIPAIKHVINFDLPQVPEDFIHRIGRTARAGAEGSALSFVGGEDRSKWNAIQRLIDPNFRAEPGSEATGRRKRGGRSFDRRGSRGKNRFERDDRPGSRFKKRDDRSDRGSRDDRPGSRFKKRDDRSDRGSRDDRPGSRFKKRDDRSDRGSRDDRPGSRFKKRDDRSDRGSRDDRPGSRFKKRDDRSDRGSRDDRPGSRFKKRDDRSDRGSRDDRPGSRFKKKFTSKKGPYKKNKFKD
jgi:ATP-dependent RNA helicase DeaD